MIYTVTLNPSLDYIVSVEEFRMGMTNRTSSERIVPGGKGINVSAVLKSLGFESTALGFVAGFTGVQIRRMVEEMGIHAEFIELPEGFSRINFKLRSPEGTEVNARGPEICAEQLKALERRLERLGGGDTLVLSGSIPPALPKEIYREIGMRMRDAGVRVIVDASAEALTQALSCRPFLIKPNLQELGEIFGEEPAAPEKIAECAKDLQRAGAENVLVSMAGKGALLAAADGKVYMAPAPEGRLVNGVGAGDSMVAGFLAGWLRKKEYLYAFRLGLAAGSASAFSEGLATGRQIQRVYRAVAGEEDSRTSLERM